MNYVPMKIIRFVLFFSCSLLFSQETEKQEISKTLDAWHAAAGDADFNTYFGLMTQDAVFVGTDAGEHWNRQAFMAYAKPHFDKGKAWNFTSVERHIFWDPSTEIAWFDELLDTQMKICRGSGVVKKEDGTWKIAHYVLSIAVPNEHVSELIEIKKAKDDEVLEQLRRN